MQLPIYPELTPINAAEALNNNNKIITKHQQYIYK